MDLWSLLESIANFFLKGDTEEAQYHAAVLFLHSIFSHEIILDLVQSLVFERERTRGGHYTKKVHFQKKFNILFKALNVDSLPFFSCKKTLVLVRRHREAQNTYFKIKTVNVDLRFRLLVQHSSNESIEWFIEDQAFS